MKTTESIATQSGIRLDVEMSVSGEQLEVVFKSRLPAPKRCLLHWGIRRAADKEWCTPPQAFWPTETMPAGKHAVQSPFTRQNGGSGVVIHLSEPTKYASLDFVLYFPDEKRWDNNSGRDYHIPLITERKPEAIKGTGHSTSPLAALRARTEGREIVFEREFDVSEGDGQLAVMVAKTGDRYELFFLSNIQDRLLLHWGIARHTPHDWLKPPAALLSPETVLWQDHTAQTPFTWVEPFNTLHLEIPAADAPLGIPFVLKKAWDGGRWINYRGGNFYVPILTPMRPAARGLAQLAPFANEIVQAEMVRNSWSLMHRFNLCHDLLERAGKDPDALALLYVWLRFSAIRQLTWQRHYNTKPRELAYAQDRLTLKLAELYRTAEAVRPILRLMLVTVGRGGEGQQIRDEILNIMHRHRVKEVSGHFLEEWHQKLHNNTTPDDIVICEAFLEFLHSNGNLDVFYKTLEAGGVTRQRLENFERPIRASPQFVPYLKDDLIRDFHRFLRILKASHATTDLETAIGATRTQLGDYLQNSLDYVWHHRNDPLESLVQLVGRITEIRRDLPAHFQTGRSLRELLYLDLALEQLLRGAVERNIHLGLSGDQLTTLIRHVLENVALSYADPELIACFRHWEKLQSQPRFSVEWSQHAKAVTERVGRGLASWIDRFYQLFQPKAEYLGHGFQAEEWSITLFSEEVVRGGSLGFVLSMLLHHLDPILRKKAHIGDWQIVSRGRGAGKVEVVKSLRDLQRRNFEQPTVVVADQVMGDEEIPQGVTAVVAPDVTDIVSHVAVRARNASILFASCHDPAALKYLKSKHGQFLQLDVKPDGDVRIEEYTAFAGGVASLPARPLHTPIAARHFTKYAVTFENFNEKFVGGKSCNLARLRRHLPEWIHLPASVALPFGVFEQVLKFGANRETAGIYSQFVTQAENDGAETLASLRRTVLDLVAPEELQSALHDALSATGLPWPDNWEKTWSCIKQVWASKWNERAFLSRKRMGIPHENLFMAVLIQQVIPADYAFVLHTVNPVNGNPDELYAEIVLGLGETLVGNHPGRALRVICSKATGRQTLLTFPSKSAGLYGDGLIFRSDSNGEDLAGYAGAGLYDSLLLDSPAERILDYSQEPLVWDDDFRRNVVAGIMRVGLEVERVFGSPQDIEGAVLEGNNYVVQTRPQVGLEPGR